MRVLVMTTERDWSMSTRLLLTAAEGLARRGDTVTACYPRATATAAGAESGFPNVALRSMSDGGFLAQWRAVRRAVSAARPMAMLVQGERDTLIAAYAIGRKGGVVRRRQFAEQLRASWRSKAAASRTKVVVFDSDQRATRLPSDAVSIAASSARSTALSWPTLAEQSPRTNHVVGTVGTVAELKPTLVVFPSHDAGATTPVALRSAAHLLTRNEALRVTLVGDETTLQGTRIHAASLGLADRLDVISVDEYLYAPTLAATAVWVTAQGDEGAVALLSAMTRSLPVVVPVGSNIESLVVPRITGFVADDEDPTSIVASLARLFADVDDHRTMGDAASARASRVHNWSMWLDSVTNSLNRAAGVRVSSRAADVMPTPT